MRPKDLVARFSGLRDSATAVSALLFLHELSEPDTLGQPPREARWQRILERPETEWGAALDTACRACLDAWPEHLDGFFGELRLAAEPAHAVKRAIDGVHKLIDSASGHGGPWDRRTLLADVSQEMRGLSAKQARGAFFTPWNVAEMMARTQLCQQDGELWILEPCVGGAVFLLAALAVYREQHGVRASKALTMIGVDIDPRVCQIARAGLLLAGADPNQFWIFTGDSLAQPIVGRDRHDGQLKTLQFHVILTNPPFGTKVSARELEAHAQAGPLVIPDRVLNRQIPRVAATPTVGDSIPRAADPRSAREAGEPTATGGREQHPDPPPVAAGGAPRKRRHRPNKATSAGDRSRGQQPRRRERRQSIQLGRRPEAPRTRGGQRMSFMLRARETGAPRHRLVGSKGLVDKWVHAITIAERSRAEEYACWLLEHNRGPNGLDSIQVIDAHKRRAKPVAVFAAAAGSRPGGDS